MRTWKVTFTIRDEKGSRGFLRVWANAPELPTDPRDDIFAFAQHLATLIDDFITGVIVSISVTSQIPLPSGLSATPETSSDVEQGMSILYRTSAGATFNHTIPTWNEDFSQASGAMVVTLETAIFLGHMIEPGEETGDWNVYPTDNRGSDLIGFVEAREDFHA